MSTSPSQQRNMITMTQASVHRQPTGAGTAGKRSPAQFGGLVLFCSLVFAACGGTSETEAVPGDASASNDGSSDSGVDATTDAVADSGSDTTQPNCPLPPGDYASCASDDECAIVSAGCYCGPQPVYGVSKSFVDAVAACEAEAAQSCMLGCMNAPWHVTDDGQEDADGGAIKVHCAAGDGGEMTCKTYLE